MRVHASTGDNREEAQYFSDLLLRIGEGKEPHLNDYTQDFNYKINVPTNTISESTAEGLLKKIFPDLT